MLIADRQPGVDHTTNVLTILGGLFSLVGLGSIGTDFLLSRSGAHDAQVLATGMRGRATVLAVRDTGVTVNMSPMIALDLRVEVPGQPVFTKTVRKVISRLDVGSYRPGLVLSVAADPARPQDIVVDWDREPIAEANAASDPVTGQPMAAADVAALLRAAADQIAAGGTAAHPGVASAVADVHAGQQLTPDQIAAILRTAAANAGTATVGTGTSSTATTGQPMSSTDLATMLRNASAAAARAADAAESTSRPAPPSAPAT
jgi:hypothetical protein